MYTGVVGDPPEMLIVAIGDLDDQLPKTDKRAAFREIMDPYAVP